MWSRSRTSLSQMSRTSWPVLTCSHDTTPDRPACIAESSLQRVGRRRAGKLHLACTQGITTFLSCFSVFYVVVDGKEGWVPSNILRLSRGRFSMSSNGSYSPSFTKSRSPSRSPSPSPAQSRSPSPMELSEFVGEEVKHTSMQSCMNVTIAH